MQIASAFDLKIEESVTSEQIEHVVEKPYASRYHGLPFTIEVNPDLHIGLTCRPLLFGGPLHRSLPLVYVTGRL
jgi:hypothetical protein